VKHTHVCLKPDAELVITQLAGRKAAVVLPESEAP